jgi:uncharacterized protein (DUF111 family)
MNKILYFDCFAGISGDMVVGALLDLGADQDKLYQHLSGLKLSGYHLHIEKQQKLGIWGTDFKVVLEEETHSPPHSASGPHHGHSHAHRGIQEISALIHDSMLSPPVKSRSLDIFNCIARAEARVHGIIPRAVEDRPYKFAPINTTRIEIHHFHGNLSTKPVRATCGRSPDDCTKIPP